MAVGRVCVAYGIIGSTRLEALTANYPLDSVA